MLALFVLACNNAGNDSKGDSSHNTPDATSDSLPRTTGGDTSSYERMQNRVTDSTPQ